MMAAMLSAHRTHARHVWALLLIASVAALAACEEVAPEPTPTAGPAPTPEPVPASQGAASDGTATGVPQAIPTPAVTAIVETGTPAGGPSGSSGGFNWAGPLIGAFAASGVFMVWTSYVNRKQYRRAR